MITKQTTKAAFEARAKVLGCTTENDGDRLSVFAPNRHVFASTGNHVQDIWYSRGRWKMGDAYASLVDDMSMGVRPCEDSECEWCNEQREECK
jgi:hypothetical protein